MDDRAAFYAPLLYSPGYLWTALCLLAAVAGWFLYVFLSTPKPQISALRSHPASDLSALRREFQDRINAVADAADSGRLPARQAHQDLSLLVRTFVRRASGVDAPRMTLAELQENCPPAVAAAIERLYPGEFAAHPQGSPAEAAETAREVVGTWS